MVAVVVKLGKFRQIWSHWCDGEISKNEIKRAEDKLGERGRGGFGRMGVACGCVRYYVNTSHAILTDGFN